MPHFRLGDAPAGDAVKRRIASALLARGSEWRVARTDVPLAFVVNGETVRAGAAYDGTRWILSGDLQGPLDGGAADASFDAAGGTVTVDGRPVRWNWPAPPSADAEDDRARRARANVVAPMPGRSSASPSRRAPRSRNTPCWWSSKR